MKLYYLVIIVAVLLIGLRDTYRLKEDFLEDYCSSYNDCMSCAGASGCSWCPSSKVCLRSTTLKSTDKACNQMNTVSSQFLCSSKLSDRIPPASVQKEAQYDYELYRNQVANKIPPPNVYITPNMEYSAETIMGTIEKLQKDLERDRMNLPTIVVNTVQEQIRPMVRGIVSESTT